LVLAFLVLESNTGFH